MDQKKRLLITIPCYNEELVLEKTTFSILEYAKQNLSKYDWQIHIIDNNSKDTTWQVAQGLVKKYTGIVTAHQIPSPGRGVALREGWSQIKGFDIYSYMDADLATDLKDFQFLVSKVDEGYDVVVGSRYLPHSDVQRTFRRKLFSKIYNILLKAVLKVDFQDAQCGFKAFSKQVVASLIPQTEDSGWFWDAELMILASRKGYKVLEVPVSWREVRDELRVSKVSVWSEVVRNLKKIYMMRKRLASNNQNKTK